MTKSADSYVTSRWNALKFGTHQDGPIRCPGVDRCRHRTCGHDYVPPLDGGLCPWEVEYSNRLESEFRRRWNLLTITPDIDDFESLVAEHVNIVLQRGRAMTRMNRSWAVRSENDGPYATSTKEFDLASLYLERLDRRQERLDAKLQAGIDRMRERVERLGPNLRVIELLVEAKERAIEDASKPRQPIWDEFIDGP